MASSENKRSCFETSADVERYDQMYLRRQRFMEHIRYYTVKSLLGDISGKTILDLGCGNGRLCGRMVEWGAKKIVGYDISENMIDECKKRNIPNTEFAVYDCLKLGKLNEQFDIATSIFVLMYLQDYSSLLSYAKSAYDNLKPEGKFCGIVCIFEAGVPLSSSTSITAGFYKRESEKEFTEVVTTFGDVKMPYIKLVHYVLYAKTIQQVMQEAGFDTFEWRPVLLSEEGRSYFKEEDVRNQLTMVRPFVATKSSREQE